MNLRRSFALTVPAVLPSVAAAAAEAGTPSFSAPSGAAGLLNVVLSLFLVIGAVVLCGWLYRRTQSLRGGPAGEVFRVVATQALGPRERVVLVEIAGKQLVLGMTASQVNTLHVFDEPVIREKMRQTGKLDSAFAERLRSMLRGGR